MAASSKGSEVIVLFGGGQPLSDVQAMPVTRPGSTFRQDQGHQRWSAVRPTWTQAFRDGQGAYVQQQGPVPTATGRRTASATSSPRSGPLKSGRCAFSSLAATRDWLATDTAKAFARAYRKTRAYMNEAPADEIAASQASYFPKIGQHVLADCIATYQELGCWTPHVEITHSAFEVTLDVFEHAGTLKKRYVYEQVCAPPPPSA